jgi:hypothetical protein
MRLDSAYCCGAWPAAALKDRRQWSSDNRAKAARVYLRKLYKIHHRIRAIFVCKNFDMA